MISNVTGLWRSRSGYLIHTAGAIILLILSLVNNGVSLHDELGHYLISLNAWQHPQYLLDLWGRPVHSILYFPGSIFGLPGARATSIILTILCAVFTARISEKFFPGSAALAACFFWLQPWVLEYGYGIHTQLPFMLLLLSGLRAFMDKAELSGGLILGLLPLVRHEGIALTGLAMLWLLYRRKYWQFLMPLLPLVLYNLLHYFYCDSWPFAIYLAAKPTQIYGQGSWLHFLPRAGGRIGLLVTALAGIGALTVFRQQRRSLLLLICPFIIYAAGHVILFRFGLFASGGYAIFLLPVTPAMAILAVRGWQSLSNRLHGRKYVVLITLLFAGQLFSVFWFAAPGKMDIEGVAAKQASAWLHQQNVPVQDIYATHVWFFYLHPLPASPQRNWEKFPSPQHLPAGSWLVWDQHYSSRFLPSIEELVSANWVEQAAFADSTIILLMKRQ